MIGLRAVLRWINLLAGTMCWRYSIDGNKGGGAVQRLPLPAPMRFDRYQHARWRYPLGMAVRRLLPNAVALERPK